MSTHHTPPPSRDRIFIEDLQLDALIGVHAEEREAAQPLQFDIALGFDNTVPAASDALADTIDYAEVVGTLQLLVTTSRYELLEALVEAMATRLMADFPVHDVRIRVHKPRAAAMLGCGGVGIEICRVREDR